jgi:hypothetical protein
VRDSYKLKGPTVKVELELEKHVAETLKAMEDFSKFKQSEIANTAMKRYISQHKDFLPSDYVVKLG